MDLKVLPFADHDPSLSFKWMNPGKEKLSCSSKELTVKRVTKTHCKDFFTCEISKNNKPFFRVYYCLRPTSESACYVNVQGDYILFLKGDASVSDIDKDELFDDVRQATKEVRADWYSLAIELGIDYGTRKVRLVCLVLHELYYLKPHPQAIESDYRFVDVCFHAVLRDFVQTTFPPLTWTALVRALKSPVINRGDIASEIEANQV